MLQARITLRLAILAVMLVLLPFPPADAKVSGPVTLDRLIAESDAIVVGTVSDESFCWYMHPALWWSVALVIGVIGLCFLRKRRFAFTSLCVLFLIIWGCLIDVVMRYQFAWKVYARKAAIDCQVCLKGSQGEIIPIVYDIGFACDRTRFEVGKTYVVFLRRIGSVYTLSWFDFAQLEVKDSLVTPTWNEEGDIRLDELTSRVRRLVRS